MNDQNSTNNQDDLDELKSLWKNQKESNEYESNEIFAMIHRKSINSVQWLFIISLIELLIGLFLSIYTIFTDNVMYSNHLAESVGETVLTKLEYLSHLGLLGSLICMGIIFYYYRKISSDSSIKELMHNIIHFRRTVIWFLILWLFLSLLFFAPLYYQLGMQTYLSKSHSHLSNEEILQLASRTGFIISLLSIIFVIVFIGSYYYLIYGYFLRRLNKNLKELKNIES